MGTFFTYLVITRGFFVGKIISDLPHYALLALCIACGQKASFRTFEQLSRSKISRARRETEVHWIHVNDVICRKKNYYFIKYITFLFHCDNFVFGHVSFCRAANFWARDLFCPSLESWETVESQIGTDFDFTIKSFQATHSFMPKMWP